MKNKRADLERIRSKRISEEDETKKEKTITKEEDEEKKKKKDGKEKKKKGEKNRSRWDRFSSRWQRRIDETEEDLAYENAEDMGRIASNFCGARQEEVYVLNF